MYTRSYEPAAIENTHRFGRLEFENDRGFTIRELKSVHHVVVVLTHAHTYIILYYYSLFVAAPANDAIVIALEGTRAAAVNCAYTFWPFSHVGARGSHVRVIFLIYRLGGV